MDYENPSGKTFSSMAARRTYIHPSGRSLKPNSAIGQAPYSKDLRREILVSPNGRTFKIHLIQEMSRRFFIRQTTRLPTLRKLLRTLCQVRRIFKT